MKTLETSTHHSRYGTVPYLCVKVHDIAREVTKGSEGTDAQQERAWQQTAEQWWNDARDIARRHGYAEVYSAGRMGGWLVTEPEPEPPTDGDGNETGPAEYPAEFVHELAEHLDYAPTMYADTLAYVIEQDAQDAEDAREAEIDAAPGLYLDWLARHMDAHPADAELCNRLAGNVRKLADI